MKTLGFVWFSLYLLVFTIGCNTYPNITGLVLDAETGQRIEDAIVLVEWTKTEGVGFTSTALAKVQEVVTDKEGRFVLSGMWGVRLDEPNLIAYKRDYVEWNNKVVFPGYGKRNDFHWNQGVALYLNRFRLPLSREEHARFLSSRIYSTAASQLRIFREFQWEIFCPDAQDNWHRDKCVAPRWTL